MEFKKLMNPKERARGLKEQRIGQVRKIAKVRYIPYTISNYVKCKWTKQADHIG